MTKELAPELEQLQRTVFPTLSDAERFKAAHYRHHVGMYPEGQFVVLDGGRLAGAASYVRMNFDFAHPNHRFADVIEGGWLTSHNPQGRWLYGADIGVHPNYRGRGVGRLLVDAAKDLCHEQQLDGIIAGGMLSGYGAVARKISAADYYAKVVSGEIKDPTISFQQHLGFSLRGLIENYLDDPVCAGWGVLIVWERS